MHLSHDGDTYVSHRSLNSFLQSLDSLDEDSQIDDLQAEPNIFFDTLETLDRLLSAFDEDCLIPVYLRVTQRLPRDTKTKLTEGGDYFIQESFAEWLILHGDSTDLPFAQRLASTGYQPVVNPARRAIDRLKRREFASAERRGVLELVPAVPPRD